MFKKKLVRYTSIFLLIISFGSCSPQKDIAAPIELSISEGFVNPLGFYDATPTFSWKLPEEIQSQTAYSLKVASTPELLNQKPDLWESGKITSNNSIFVHYEGQKLNSRQKVYWQIQYWDEHKEASAWSEIAHFELGLLQNDDWKGQWIGLDTAKDSIKGVRDFLMHRPQYIRKTFELPEDVVSARLYSTAKGVFDVYINAKDVSTDVMPPGWTPYNKRIETLTYDVTDLLTSGPNSLALEVASGWHAGRISRGKSVYDNFASPKVLVQLEIELKDGTKKMIVSDNTWKGSTNGPIRLAGIYDGETYDANLEMPQWNSANFDDSSWLAVEQEALDPEILLAPKRHYTVKEKIIVEAKKIVSKTDRTVIFDFGQNMVGVPLLQVPMKKGDTLKIRFSEMLAPDGSFYTENYRSALSTNFYVAAKDGAIQWSPKFTFHGFQFAELSGYDTTKEPELEWIKGVVQYSDFDANGTFSSSHTKLNQLQSNIVWGLRGNFFDVPTDCPQRDERLGWTGDAQVIAPTALFNADVHSFWTAWLQSMRETQSEHEDGLVPYIIPDVLQNQKASSGWGDAAVIIPWDIYQRTGDITVLEENYDMATKWVGFHTKEAQEYISNMNSFSDWLQPYPTVENDKRGDTPRKLINTAFYAHAAHLTGKIATALNKTEDAKKYHELYKKIANAFENEFFNEDGSIKNNLGTQTGYLLALDFDLLSAAKEEKAKTHLLAKIKEADNHLRTGFLGTPLLPKVLDNMGELDLMYTMLLKETYPSWFYPINQGATTMWERWNSYSKQDGYNTQSMNSLNHYAYGAIGQWMYERIAGIAPLKPGYKEIQIAPRPGGGLTSAEASYNCSYGKIASGWKIADNTFELKVTIPPNTSAKISIPSTDAANLLVNGQKISNTKAIKLIENTAKTVELEAQPGSYVFLSKI